MGSAWEEFRNTDLNANDFFNNANGLTRSPRADLTAPDSDPEQLRHPFWRPLETGTNNKTFFNGIYDPYKQRQQAISRPTVYTQTARNGIFRYYPGVLNGNATAANPSGRFHRESGHSRWRDRPAAERKRARASTRTG